MKCARGQTHYIETFRSTMAIIGRNNVTVLENGSINTFCHKGIIGRSRALSSSAVFVKTKAPNSTKPLDYFAFAVSPLHLRASKIVINVGAISGSASATEK